LVKTNENVKPEDLKYCVVCTLTSFIVCEKITFYY